MSGCPMCGSTDVLVVFEDVDVLMVRCQRCRHRYEDWDDIPPAA